MKEWSEHKIIAVFELSTLETLKQTPCSTLSMTSIFFDFLGVVCLIR